MVTDCGLHCQDQLTSCLLTNVSGVSFVSAAGEGQLLQSVGVPSARELCTRFEHNITFHFNFGGPVKILGHSFFSSILLAISEFV